jgi:hypothetical protein
MRKVNSRRIALGVVALGLLFMVLTSPVPEGMACRDNDNDGVCSPYDCNDNNPLKSSTEDLDGDGRSECDGDCRDDDPTITFCAETAWRQFPIFYEPGEQGCRTGIKVTRTFGNPPISEEVTYLTDCAYRGF